MGCSDAKYDRSRRANPLPSRKGRRRLAALLFRLPHGADRVLLHALAGQLSLLISLPLGQSHLDQGQRWLPK
jgi:hypothetical protein